MDFINRFRQFSTLDNPVFNQAPTLLAVSGGVDSMVMLYLFRESGLEFGVAHCNFQLRGAESDGDAQLVQSMAHKLAVPFFVKRFETKAYAEKNGISTQMAARDLRYEWFAEIAQTHGYHTVATAHNLNDSVETALLNFIRGTGLAGITGIRQHDSMGRTGLLRPLLFASRDEILEYALANQITWREDSSNASDDYTRNFLRHQIVPKMQEINPNLLRTAERNLERLRETKDNLDFLTRQFLGLEQGVFDGSTGTYSIDKQKLAQIPSPRRVLHDMLKPHGFTGEQARQLAENLDHIGFELQSASGWQVLCDRRVLVVSCQLIVDRTSEGASAAQRDAIRIEAGDLMVRLPGGKALFFMAMEAGAPFPDGSEAVLVQAEKLVFPLMLRHWAEGDSFQPFGMGGQSQKLQDFFTNQKLSRIEKEQVWLLFNGDGALIWVVGLRLDERFRIQDVKAPGIKIRLT